MARDEGRSVSADATSRVWLAIGVGQASPAYLADLAALGVLGGRLCRRVRRRGRRVALRLQRPPRLVRRLCGAACC